MPVELSQMLQMSGILQISTIDGFESQGCDQLAGLDSGLWVVCSEEDLLGKAPPEPRLVKVIATQVVERLDYSCLTDQQRLGISRSEYLRVIHCKA